MSSEEALQLKNPVVFVGSSSIRKWYTADYFPDVPIVNRGFGGSHISDVIFFINETVLKFNPKVIVFYAGDNDINFGKSYQTVFEDYVNFVEKVRAKVPNTRIVFIPIKPSPARWSLWNEMEKANHAIQKYSQKHSFLYYIDTASPMLNNRGKPKSSLFAKDSLQIGLEIIFFDVEDYGAPNYNSSFFDLNSMNDTWCLGSQFWCYNLDTNYQKPKFGILLDMVGAKNAVFPKEEISRQYSGYHLNKIWKLGDYLGYGNYFKKKIAPPLTDDHTYINKLAQIPTLDIIHYDISPFTNRFDFGKFHHTHQDNLDIIEIQTLKAVGQTVLTYLYNI